MMSSNDVMHKRATASLRKASTPTVYLWCHLKNLRRSRSWGTAWKRRGTLSHSAFVSIPQGAVCVIYVRLWLMCRSVWAAMDVGYTCCHLAGKENGVNIESTRRPTQLLRVQVLKPGDSPEVSPGEKAPFKPWMDAKLDR